MCIIILPERRHRHECCYSLKMEPHIIATTVDPRKDEFFIVCRVRLRLYCSGKNTSERSIVIYNNS